MLCTNEDANGDAGLQGLGVPQIDYPRSALRKARRETLPRLSVLKLASLHIAIVAASSVVELLIPDKRSF